MLFLDSDALFSLALNVACEIMCLSECRAVNSAATGLPKGKFTGRGGKAPINYNVVPIRFLLSALVAEYLMTLYLPHIFAIAHKVMFTSWFSVVYSEYIIFGQLCHFRF